MTIFSAKWELQLLQFLAGRPIPAPSLNDVELEEILILIHRHRLQNASYQTLKGSRETRPDLVKAVERQFEKLVDRCNIQLAATTALFKEFPELADAILIKGNGRYLASGDNLSMRRSSDVDLVINPHRGVDLNAVARASTSYRDKRLPPHEALNVHIFGADFDIHDYVPYIKHANDFEEKRRAGGAFVSITELHSLDYKFLSNHTLKSNWGGAEITSVKAEMAAVISASAMYRDFSRPMGLRYLPPVRMGDLLEFGILLSDGSFQWPIFNRIAVDCGVEYQIAWALCLLTRYMMWDIGPGEELVGRYITDAPLELQCPAATLRCLWRYGCSAPGDYVLRHTPISVIVEQSRAILNACVDDGRAEPVLLLPSYQRAERPASALRVSVIFRNNTTEIHVDLQELAGKGAIRILVETDSFGTVCDIDLSEMAILEKRALLPDTFSAELRGTTFYCAINTSALGHLNMMVSAAHAEEDKFASFLSPASFYTMSASPGAGRRHSGKDR